MLVLLYTNMLYRGKIVREFLGLIKLNKYDEALDKINKALKFYLNEYGLMSLKLVVLGSLEKYDEKLELSNMLIKERKLNLSSKKELSDKDVFLFNSKIVALLKLKRYDEAEELINKTN